jgi:hypothetical protein
MGAPGIEPAISDSAVTEFEPELSPYNWAGRRSERPGADAARPASTLDGCPPQDKMAVQDMSVPVTSVYWWCGSHPASTM